MNNFEYSTSWNCYFVHHALYVSFWLWNFSFRLACVLWCRSFRILWCFVGSSASDSGFWVAFCFGPERYCFLIGRWGSGSWLSWPRVCRCFGLCTQPAYSTPSMVNSDLLPDKLTRLRLWSYPVDRPMGHKMSLNFEMHFDGRATTCQLLFYFFLPLGFWSL